MDIYYVRYSDNRRKSFQIKTLILNDGNKVFVRKSPIYEQGHLHIQKIYDNYFRLKSIYQGALVCHSSYKEYEYIDFDFIEGVSINEHLIRTLTEHGINMFKSELLNYVNLIESVAPTEEFVVTEQFCNLFGSIEGSNYSWHSFKYNNVDLNFDNIIIDSDHKLNVVDYEWVFDFPIPIEYIKFRSVFYFCINNSKILEGKVKLEEILQLVGISEQEQEMFTRFDDKFIDYVTNSSNINMQNFLKKDIHVDMQSNITRSLNKNFYSQLYIEKNNMISEEESLVDSVAIDMNSGDVKVRNVFSNLDFSKLDNFRYDPLNVSCLIEIHDIYIIENGNKHYCPFEPMNAMVTKGNMMLFTSNDPQIYIWNEKHVNGFADLVVDFVVKEIELELCKSCQVLDEHNSKLHEAITSSEDRINQVNSEISALKDKNIELEAEIINRNKENLELTNLIDSLQKTYDDQVAYNNELAIEKHELSNEIHENHETISNLLQTIESMRIRNRIKKILKLK